MKRLQSQSFGRGAECRIIGAETNCGCAHGQRRPQAIIRERIHAQ